MGDIFWLLARGRRRVTLGNLQLALGEEKSAKELQVIGRYSFESLVRGACEMVRFALTLDEAKAREKIALEGLEHLKRALMKGRGVVAFTGHLGNFTIIGPRLALEGIPFAYMVKPFKDKYATEFLFALANKWGVEMIPTKPPEAGVRRALRFLKDGGVVCFVADQYQKRGGVRIKFFGKETTAPAGHVRLALRTGAPIVPMFCIREGELLRVIILEEVNFPLTGDKEVDIITGVERLSALLEELVKKYPGQWFWLHRRWRN